MFYNILFIFNLIGSIQTWAYEEFTFCKNNMILKIFFSAMGADEEQNASTDNKDVTFKRKRPILLIK